MLTPLDLGGVHDDDLTVEALQLDPVSDEIEVLRQTIITDTAELMPSSNRIHLTPIRGDIKKPYFVSLAAALGYTIRIDDYIDSMSGWLCAGDEVLEDLWIYFTAGCAMAGDYLASEDVIIPWIWEVVVIASPETTPTPDLEAVFNDLKPAELHLNFTYL